MSALAPMTPQQHSKLSHTLSKILRHAATQLGLKLDSAGYAVVDDLLDLPMIRKLGFVNLQALQYVVKECPKQRFSLISPNAQQDGFAHWKIRANQGHNVTLAESLDIHSLLTPITLATNPLPPFCIHGTTKVAFEAIVASGGLHQMQRTHIHFASEDFGSASLISGMRKDSQILIHVDIHSALQWAASHSPPLHLEFFQSANSVILTDGVKEYAGVLPTFLYSRVEQVVKGVRSDLEWNKPSEQEWMKMFEQNLTAKANQAAAASSSSSSSLDSAFVRASPPAKKQQPSPSPSVSSASSAEFIAHTPPPAKPSPWGPPASSRPPSDWIVPERLKHIVNGTPAPTVAQPVVAATAAAKAPVSAPRAQNFDYLVVLDFEATCDDKNNGSRFAPSEIIEFPMVLINLASGKVDAEFHRYVTPVVNRKLTPFCTSLTGITQSMVSKENGASPFQEVYEAANEFLQQHGLASSGASSSSSSASKRFAFVTCGDWDLKTMLPSQLETTFRSKAAPAHFSSWINIKQLYNDFYNPKNTARGMTDMLNQLKLSLEGRHHSGIDDTRNIARICQRMLQDGAFFTFTNKKVKIDHAANYAASSNAQKRPLSANPSSSLSNALNKNQRSRIQ